MNKHPANLEYYVEAVPQIFKFKRCKNPKIKDYDDMYDHVIMCRYIEIVHAKMNAKNI